jgi:hypothetical protein
MTNETMKAPLMLLIIGGLQAALHIPKAWASRQWALLARAMIDVRSTIVSTGRTLQPVRIKSGSDKRRLPR